MADFDWGAFAFAGIKHLSDEYVVAVSRGSPSLRMFDRWAIQIKLSELPDFTAHAEVRDRLAMMHPIRRWLSFRLRREGRRLQLAAQQAIINAVIEQGEGVMGE